MALKPYSKRVAIRKIDFSRPASNKCFNNAKTATKAKMACSFRKNSYINLLIKYNDERRISARAEADFICMSAMIVGIG
jgi:hypothetical protein